MSTTTLTETKPDSPGWYWFMPNGLSPKKLNSERAINAFVREYPLCVRGNPGSLYVRFTLGTFHVSEMGGLWSERLEEPE